MKRILSTWPHGRRNYGRFTLPGHTWIFLPPLRPLIYQQSYCIDYRYLAVVSFAAASLACVYEGLCRLAPRGGGLLRVVFETHFRCTSVPFNVSIHLYIRIVHIHTCIKYTYMCVRARARTHNWIKPQHKVLHIMPVHCIRGKHLQIALKRVCIARLLKNNNHPVYSGTFFIYFFFLTVMGETDFRMF